MARTTTTTTTTTTPLRAQRARAKPCRLSRSRTAVTPRANGRGGDGPVVFSFDDSGEFVKRTEGETEEEEEGARGAEASSSFAADGFKTSLTDDPAFKAGSSAVDADETYAMTPLDKAPAVAKQSFVSAPPADRQREQVRSFLYPGEDELPDDVSMTIWEHLEELRERAIVSAAVVSALILVCFCFAKDLTIFLEEPVKSQGVRFLQLGPGEYFFTTVKVAGYSGLLAGAPVVLYEAIAYVLPGLTLNERKTLGPIVLGSSVLFYGGIAFAYAILVPAALKFFVGYADGAVESLWSIDQYFEFVLVLLFSTGLSFQVPVIQLLLGQTGIVTSKQMLSVWRYVVVGSVIAAAVLTPSTDPFTQLLLAAPLMSLYLGGAALVGVFEREREGETAA